MANGNRAAIWIDAFPRKCTEVAHQAGLAFDPILVLQGRDVGQHLCSKGFMDLPKIDVIITQVVTLEEPRNGIRWRHQEHLVKQIDCRYLEIDDQSGWRTLRET